MTAGVVLGIGGSGVASLGPGTPHRIKGVISTGKAWLIRTIAEARGAREASGIGKLAFPCKSVTAGVGRVKSGQGTRKNRVKVWALAAVSAPGAIEKDQTVRDARGGALGVPGHGDLAQWAQDDVRGRSFRRGTRGKGPRAGAAEYGGNGGQRRTALFLTDRRGRGCTTPCNGYQRTQHAYGAT